MRDPLRDILPKCFDDEPQAARRNRQASGGVYTSNDEDTPIRLRLQSMADVEPESIDWLWPNRIPLGKLTNLAGDPGLGKSILALDIIARVTVGGAFADQIEGIRNPSGSAIIIGCEDGIADTVRPRLDAAGANVNRVHHVQGTQMRHDDPTLDMFNMQRDVRHLKSAIDAIGDVKLVVIDPLSAYLGEKTNTHRDADVRRVLTPLAEMAEATGVAVLGILHLNKNTKGKAIYRVTGSLGFTAVARMVWLVGEDQHDPERRIMALSKGNVAKDPGALAFRVVDPGRIEWEGATCETANELVQDGDTMKTVTARDDAKEFLRELLANGKEMEANEIERLAGEAKPKHSRSTLFRAKKELGIRARKTGQREDAVWWWWNPKAENANIQTQYP